MTTTNRSDVARRLRNVPWDGSTRHRPKVGLIGFFGWGNYGDELFLQLWRRELSPYFDVAPVHELLIPPYVVEDSETVAARHDAFVIGGGDLVIPNGVSGLYWKPEWLTRKVYIVGVGVATWGHRHLPEVIEEMAAFFRHPNIQYISARDEPSAEWIRTHLRPLVPVLVHPDLVFCLDLPPARATSSPNGKRRLGISVRQGLYNRNNDYAALDRFVADARQEGYAISLIELASGRQRRRDARAVQQLPFTPDEVIGGSDLDTVSAAIGGLDALVSMKYHGLVVALRYGVPALALTPNAKNVNLMNSIDRMDLVGDMEGDMDLSLKLGRLRVPVARGRVDALGHEARTALDALVRQMRIQLDPIRLAPRSVRESRQFLREVLPDAVRLARSRRRREKVSVEADRVNEGSDENAVRESSVDHRNS
ncbi:polysaccharide pyruvyl transferase family protein [Citricoccus sp. K5]|uniref:polysaccharide pyruvyl transferase family protein n=1 Tax=Citricoccus sp. K5 TaxID=2653135 RepID=UPI00135B66F9|nr:polysaccharide pyruvyl transferase family protein [Citricoccus sp. K5]